MTEQKQKVDLTEVDRVAQTMTDTPKQREDKERERKLQLISELEKHGCSRKTSLSKIDNAFQGNRKQRRKKAKQIRRELPKQVLIVVPKLQAKEN